MKNSNRIISKLAFGAIFLTGASFLFASYVPFTQGKDDKWVAPASSDKAVNPQASNEKNLAAGKEIFNSTCATCHGKKGKGDGPKTAELEKTVPDFTKGALSKQTDGALFWKITEGRKPMPSFKKDLTEEQRWLVINYCKELCAKK
ncbi:MAG: c-type cytochrome [Bacteroidia bacterium]